MRNCEQHRSHMLRRSSLIRALFLSRRPSWSEECTALIGDAWHPMLPYVAQGAAQAIEDGAVIGVVLSGVRSSSRQEIKNALLLYQVIPPLFLPL
jgi:2-polyprenyl-6-methoxyphenol hydroxylase-like FAD-dependent oxidoreductase